MIKRPAKRGAGQEPGTRGGPQQPHVRGAAVQAHMDEGNQQRGENAVPCPEHRRRDEQAAERAAGRRVAQTLAEFGRSTPETAG